MIPLPFLNPKLDTATSAGMRSMCCEYASTIGLSEGGVRQFLHADAPHLLSVGQLRTPWPSNTAPIAGQGERKIDIDLLVAGAGEITEPYGYPVLVSADGEVDLLGGRR